MNKNYNLYYWSSSPNDALTYNEFMKNYTNSGYKGTYTENKGVILRNAEGVYYLYALAKDDDSTVVVRSSEYVLKKSEAINKITRADVIIFSIMAVGAFSPIFIYLCIRGKDME